MVAKVLTISNEKGGVGKSFLAVQTAFYAAYQCGCKTLFIDLDSQANASRVLIKNEMVTLSNIKPADLFLAAEERDINTDAEIGGEENSNLQLISAINSKEELITLQENQESELIQMYSNFVEAIGVLKSQFDLIVIDSNPNADIRSNSAVGVADIIISPIQLYTESIQGLEGIVNRVGQLNNTARVYFIPNMVDHSELQVRTAEKLVAMNKDMLLPIHEISVTRNDDQIVIEECELHYGVIKRRNCFAVAQDIGKGVWIVNNNKSGWREIRRVLFTIMEAIEVDKEFSAADEVVFSLEKLKQAHPDKWKRLLRHLWMCGHTFGFTLPGLSQGDVQNLIGLKETSPISLVS